MVAVLLLIVSVYLVARYTQKQQRLEGLGPTHGGGGGGGGRGAPAADAADAAYANPAFEHPNAVELTPNVMYAPAGRPTHVPLTANVMYAASGGGSSGSNDVVYAIPAEEGATVAASNDNNVYDVGTPRRTVATSNNVYDVGTPRIRIGGSSSA